MACDSIWTVTSSPLRSAVQKVGRFAALNRYRPDASVAENPDQFQRKCGLTSRDASVCETEGGTNHIEVHAAQMVFAALGQSHFSA